MDVTYTKEATLTIEDKESLARAIPFLPLMEELGLILVS